MDAAQVAPGTTADTPDPVAAVALDDPSRLTRDLLRSVGPRLLRDILGPTMTFPTASDKQLGAGKYSAGPAAVALTMQGPWVVGALANNQWSFAGWGDTNIVIVGP